MRILKCIFTTVIACVLFASVVHCNDDINPEQNTKKSDLSDRCQWKPDGGPCKAIFDKYYYDSIGKKCLEFMYGGCGGVVPFDSMEECSQACKDQGVEGADGLDATEKLMGKWMICDKNIPGSPMALEIPGNGFLNMHAIRSIPPFNEKKYDQWIFKPDGESTATAKSPGGEELSLSLEKAGSDYLLEVKMGDAYLLLYRPSNEKDRTGFTGTWNMPALPMLEFTTDGLVSFPSGNPMGTEGSGTYTILSGNRIAVYAKDKNGVDTVLVVLKPSDDPDMLTISGNENDYREAGEHYEKPGGDMEKELYSMVKGPTGDFFYQQPMIAEQATEYGDSRKQADYLSCYYSLMNLQSAQEMYYIDNGEYATDISQLDSYTYECADSGDCIESALATIERLCLPGSFKLGTVESGDSYSYKMTAQTKDNTPCNICVTSSGSYPESFDGCPNEDIYCDGQM